MSRDSSSGLLFYLALPQCGRNQIRVQRDHRRERHTVRASGALPGRPATKFRGHLFYGDRRPQQMGGFGPRTPSRPSFTAAPMRQASPPGSFVQGLPCHLAALRGPSTPAAVSPSIYKTPSGTRLCALAQALPSLGQRPCVLGGVVRRSVSAPAGAALTADPGTRGTPAAPSGALAGASGRRCPGQGEAG